jgi:hypothetical protein
LKTEKVVVVVVNEQLLRLLCGLFRGSTPFSSFPPARHHLLWLKVRKQGLASDFDEPTSSEVSDHHDSKPELEL